jgi:hypothetical protein
MIADDDEVSQAAPARGKKRSSALTCILVTILHQSATSKAADHGPLSCRLQGQAG